MSEVRFGNNTEDKNEFHKIFPKTLVDRQIDFILISRRNQIIFNADDIEMIDLILFVSADRDSRRSGHL